MLYDPKWEVQTKPDVYSVADLIAWLEIVPAEQEYHAGNPQHCLLGQWIGLCQPDLDACEIMIASCKLGYVAPFEQIAMTKPHNFGTALKRARAASSAAK